MTFKPTPRPNFVIYPAVADAIIEIGEKLKGGCTNAEAEQALKHLIAYAVGQSCDLRDLAIRAIEASPLGCCGGKTVDGKWVETLRAKGNGGYLQAKEQARVDHLANLREAIAHPDYSHARDRDGYVSIYHRDHTSPSGVMAAEYGKAEDVNPMIREIRDNSPLSPTEGLYAPSRG